MQSRPVAVYETCATWEKTGHGRKQSFDRNELLFWAHVTLTLDSGNLLGTEAPKLTNTHIGTYLLSQPHPRRAGNGKDGGSPDNGVHHLSPDTNTLLPLGT